MAIVQGFSMRLVHPLGLVSVTAFYDDADGRPVRLDTTNTTGRPFRVRLALADGSRQVSAVIQAGSNSVIVPAQVAQRIDLRPYGDEPGELPGVNPTAWVCQLEI